MIKMQINYYILTASDFDSRLLSKPSAFELAKYRLENSKWGFSNSTKNRKRININDKVIIYISGKRDFGMNFIATAEVKTKPVAILDSRANEIDFPKKFNQSISTSYIDIDNVDYLSRPVPIKLIKNKLSFIKNKNIPNWGCYLQGGCITITKEDYLAILEASNES